MSKTQEIELRARTKNFALRIIRLYVSLPKTTEAQVIGKQLLRSGTSVGAHYREAQRAKSTADFISKLEGALQELDETAYWLELLGEAKIVPTDRLAPLVKETDELIAIFVTIVNVIVQPTLSLRAIFAKQSPTLSTEDRNAEIASSQKTLLAMTPERLR
jgi:four helix bundle protein